MPRCFLLLVFLSVASAEDAYESRVGDDFVERTTFRFRTKFNRVFIENDFRPLLSRKVSVPPLLDGRLEDPCWQIADRSKSAFVQWQTREPNRKQTVIYVCHDDEHLYMATVCEEPNTKGVQMLSHHPGARRRWTTAGKGDSIEAFLELGGVGGTGQIFQFIYNIHPEVRYWGLVPTQEYVGCNYRMGGALGAKRWVCELAFPYKNWHTEGADLANYRYRGPARRGEVWGIRVVRNGPRAQRGEERMRSTWTFNPNQRWHIPFPTGIIVFEDRNALRNAEMNEVDPKTLRPLHWTQRIIGGARGKLRFDDGEGHAVLAVEKAREDEGMQVSQKFGVLPNVGYRLTGKVKKLSGEGRILIGVDRPRTHQEIEALEEWEDIDLDFFAEYDQRDAYTFIQVLGGRASVAMDGLRVEQQIFGAPPGATCLTGNSPRIDLNLPKEALEKVRYTYREPGTDKEEFPYRKRWSPGWIHGIADVGGTTGWILATKGSLTSVEGRKMIQWSCMPPKAGYVPYPKGHELIFDLGQEYYVRSVEFLPSAAIYNMTVHVRAEGSDEFILTSKLRGEGVYNPPGPALYGRMRKIDSVGRYVKFWFLDGAHGMYFVRIWGEPKGDRTGIKRFRWKDGRTVPEEKYRQFRKLAGPVLMPTPQEVEWGDGEFVVQDGTPVVFRPDGHGERTAEILLDEGRAMFGISLRAVAEMGTETPASGTGAIVLGEANAGLAARMAKARGWNLNDERPGIQGYFLSSSPDGILVCGYDQAGTFYGVQTLLQLLVRRDWQAAAARAAEIRDWPYIPLRMIDIRGALTPPMIRTLARLKVNVLHGGLRSHAEMAEDYFLFAHPPYAGHSAGGPIEMDDDENWHFLGQGAGGYRRINACPSHLARYEFYEGAGRRAFAGTSIGGININTDEMDHNRSGSRWNNDRRCLSRQMMGDELFTEMIMRAYDTFRQYNRKTAILDTMLVAGNENGNGDYHNMHFAYDRIPEDMHVYCWRGMPGHSNCDPEEAIRRFECATMLQGSFPFWNRGKLNEFYQAPPGKGVWEVWNSVWGVAGPVDQVLTGQFCRSMTMVDGGCAIPFMTQGWNPDAPPVHTEEWVLKVGHLQQRLGEIALERELPSWRDGVQKEFFKIDMRAACNWSHIDPVPGDGRDWLDWGPNNDLRRMPRGDVQFEEVPFQVIDPATNRGKSIIMVGALPKNSRLTVPGASREIPVARKAASLVFLRANIKRGHVPGYRITYAGGRFLTVPLEPHGNESKKYSCYGLYPPGKPSRAPDDPGAFYKRAKHGMVELFSLFYRPAWLGNTTAGDPVKITLHEWVNPYPELDIESVSVRYPLGRQSSRIEVLFAVTGVAPTARDLTLWQDRRKFPVVEPNAVEIQAGDTPVIPEDGDWAEEGPTPTTYLDPEGNKVCTVTGLEIHDPKWTKPRNLFKRMDDACLANSGTIQFAEPKVCRKIAVRGLFCYEYHGDKVHYGISEFRRTDYTIEVSADGKTWRQAAAKQGICGEDGAHVHALPGTPIKAVRVKLSGRHYALERAPRNTVGEGLSWIQLYR